MTVTYPWDGVTPETVASSTWPGCGQGVAVSTTRGAGRGAQHAILGARLRFAAERGCTLAMMCAQPGSGSQRNAERHGFRIAYTRTKWHLSR